MTNATLASTLLALAALAASPAVAQDAAKTDPSGKTVTVKPGEGPTETMTKELPPMDEDTARGVTKEGQHPPTKQVGKEVPPMQPQGKQADQQQAQRQ